MCYANDTIIFEVTEEEIATLLNRIEQESEKVGLTINRYKPKFIIVDKPNQIVRSDLLNGIERIISFVYLGSAVRNVGGCEDKIKRRISLARNFMTWLTQI